VDAHTTFVENEAACEALSITDLQDLVASINIYPNPASELLTIDDPTKSIHRIKIHNVSGQLIKAYKEASSEIQVGQLPAGIYFINLETPLGVVRKKFIKE
ncbi:MAG: T9SS type A sorting domain-containing protein, partial [Flavobacteriaceae bacterium]|nr:T9SS type A sorting domain-containing protein [Flavobacteriaceae bacterium]